MKTRTLLLAGLLLAPLPAYAQEAPTPEDQERWAYVRETLFPGRKAEPAGDRLALEAPNRAADASIVPIAVTAKDDPADPVTKLHLFIDDNPVPRALSATLGPAAARPALETRVRVNEYTWVHAVAETKAGRLLETGRFVKASGGCSAPALKDPAEAAARLGRMKLNLPADFRPGEPVKAQILVSHPNNSGLQFDQVSRTYIPAHYVDKVLVRYNGQEVATVEADISLSEDPSLHFAFTPEPTGTLEVEVTDSKGASFKQSWPVAARGS
ncbi:quinoprotein dehydrogenase-associated SoxYZ-like carrier [Aerophototrophica crusticola]|uniref:Quinoprotein dehydrogenase-associated SoxYZ-like carrier n=1 Tax=Aerophototrophica crusticola TaxID=1709002 RepID=A0A858R4G5_9PROT|nr:quinoprotein dehydrogenase-associated SoxYZ-like carrier [Rhodospirillaceae bacterium B3]